MATFKTRTPERVPSAREGERVSSAREGQLSGGFWRWLHGFYQTGRIEPAGERRPAPPAPVRRARASR